MLKDFEIFFGHFGQYEDLFIAHEILSEMSIPSHSSVSLQVKLLHKLLKGVESRNQIWVVLKLEPLGDHKTFFFQIAAGSSYVGFILLKRQKVMLARVLWVQFFLSATVFLGGLVPPWSITEAKPFTFADCTWGWETKKAHPSKKVGLA